jgi:hypothetical protein
VVCQRQSSAYSLFEVETRWQTFIEGRNSIMFNFAKKNAEIEEQVLEVVTDEQLSQVTGGLLDTNIVILNNNDISLIEFNEFNECCKPSKNEGKHNNQSC